MDPEQKDVTQAASEPAAQHDTGVDPVNSTGSGDTGDERPVKNALAEYNRKLAKVLEDQRAQAQRMETLMQYIVASQQQTPRPQQAAQAGPDTDEVLWARAQAGDRLAFEEYQRRIARREFQQANTINTRQQVIDQQLNALMTKYPFLNDGSHPLTQAAQAAYQLLVRSGYPADRSTLLDAAKTALADRPDLIDGLPAQTREGVRRSATSAAQSGQTGASHRQEPAQSRDNTKVSLKAGEADLARRMGIKDPVKAKERFLKRQESGQSALGAVSGFVREEEF